MQAFLEGLSPSELDGRTRSHVATLSVLSARKEREVRLIALHRRRARAAIVAAQAADPADWRQRLAASQQRAKERNR